MDIGESPIPKGDRWCQKCPHGDWSSKWSWEHGGIRDLDGRSHCLLV